MGLTRRGLLGGLTAAGIASWLGATPALAAGPRHVVLVRFGGGVRRRETLDPDHTDSPFLARVLAGRGVLFPHMEIARIDGVETSHAQGTLHLLLGRYDHYRDVSDRILGERFVPDLPTLPEALRAQQGLAEHRVLVVNNENRLQDEFLYFTDAGVADRPGVLSRYRYRLWNVKKRLAAGEDVRQALGRLVEQDWRGEGLDIPVALDAFWREWEAWWGGAGPRGDAGQTELAVWALRTLRPRLLVLNWSDCDYVHWGDPSYYHRGIAVMDQGLKRLVQAVESDPVLRDDTVFVVVPDCGRDDNRMMAVPYQHHFGDRTAHEIFALVFGPGIPGGVVVDKPVQQIDVAPTLAALLGIDLPHAQGRVLEEVWG